MTNPIITEALSDLENEDLWEPLHGNPDARTALEAARKTAQNTLGNIDLSTQEIPLLLRLGRISHEKSMEDTLLLIGRKRGALKFLRLIETRQARMQGATVKLLTSAIHRHEDSVRGEQSSGFEPETCDLELWQVAA